MQLGGIQYRCMPYKSCPIPYSCCGCIEQSYPFDSPKAITVLDTGRCDGSYAGKTLPLCKGGNKKGRYIKMPPILQSLCGVDEFSERIASMQRMTTDSAKWNVFSTKIKQDYTNKIKDTNTTMVWNAAITAVIQDRSYHKVLSAYASGNPCALADIRPHRDSNIGALAIYAPYSCKYHLFSVEESEKCMMPKLKVVFDGDSMARELYAALLGIINRSSVSASAIKTELNGDMIRTGKAVIHRSSSSGMVNMSLVYSWEFRKRNIIRAVLKESPDVYITNYGLMHNLDTGVNEFMKSFSDNTLLFWTNMSVARPIVKIFQSGRDNHGMRDPRFVSEVIRQSNFIMRNVYISELHFIELDEYWLTEGVLESNTWNNDGWHLDYESKLNITK